ncbi:MAG: FtsQ-type POTRA domain-containing protein, partial [Aquihabitans sp.]
RRLRRLALLVLVMLVGLAAFALTRSPVLDLDHIGVQGVEGQQMSEVRTVSGLTLGSPLLDVAPASVAAKVENLAWVRSAAVTRHWPGSVQIDITPRVPVATAAHGADTVAIDRTGQVIGPVTGSSVLPSLDLTPPAVGQTVPAPWRSALAVVADLPAPLLAEVTSARVGSAGIELTLQDGIEVRFGDASRLRAKSVALEALLDRAGRSSIRSIDVRVPANPSLTRTPGGGA